MQLCGLLLYRSHLDWPLLTLNNLTTAKPSSLGILLISSLFSVGPAYGGVCKELAAKLAESNWQVITTSNWSNRMMRPLDMLTAIFRHRVDYDVTQIDVFSGSAFIWAELSARALRRLQKPFVLTLHGGNLPAFAEDHAARVRNLLNSAAMVTTPSIYLSKGMEGYRSDIRLVPNPIEIGPYSFRLRAAPHPNLLYLRALHRMYNPCLAVTALQELHEHFPAARLILAGPDKHDGAANDLRAAIASTQLQDSVAVVGAVSKVEVPRLMDQADIFLNTTNVDNTPISVIEALACGMCIVSTNVGGIPYLLTHEHDALLVPPNDPQSMADAIRRILTEPGLAERLSRNARKTAEQFDWSIILPQWEALLTEVIEKHARD